MSGRAKFEQKQLGIGTFLGFAILMVQYIALALIVWIILNGQSPLDPFATAKNKILSWGNSTGSSASAPQ